MFATLIMGLMAGQVHTQVGAFFFAGHARGHNAGAGGHEQRGDLRHQPVTNGEDGKGLDGFGGGRLVDR